MQGSQVTVSVLIQKCGKDTGIQGGKLIDHDFLDCVGWKWCELSFINT